MRELKFRMKIKNDAKIWEVYAIDWLNLKALRDISGSMEWIDFEKIEQFLQYIGLKDKNGKEIYEGDICREVHLYAGEKIGEVSYSAEMGWVCGWKLGDTFISSMAKEIEIIGNIYSNPELLK